MKNLIAISAAALTASTASAGVLLYTNYNESTAGANDGWNDNTYYATVTKVVDTLAYANSTSATTVTSDWMGSGVAGYAAWTATTSGTSLALSGTFLSDQVMTATPGGSNIVITFTDPGGTTQGNFGAAIAFTVTGTVTGNVIATFDNGLTSQISLAAPGTGFFGVWNENPISGNFYKIQSITFSTSGTGTLAIDTIYVGNVPAPGAIALVGVAGLVGSRRRRG